MTECLAQLRKKRAEIRAEVRAKLVPPPDPTIVVRPWTAKERYSAAHWRGRSFFVDVPDEEVDTRLPSERMGCEY